MDKHMPHDSLSFLQRIQEYGVLSYAVFVALSAWAGVVRFAIDVREGKKPCFIDFLAQIIISCFVGLMTGLMCQYYRVDVLLACIVASVSASIGAPIINLLEKWLKKNSPISIEERQAEKPFSKRKESE